MQISSTDFIAFQKYQNIQIKANPGDYLLGSDDYPELRHFTAPKRKNASRLANIALRPNTFSPSSTPSVAHSEVPSVMISSSPTYSSSNYPTEEKLTLEPSSLTSMPSIGDSGSPTAMPKLNSSSPTAAPTTTSSPTMTGAPTVEHSNSPTNSPTITNAPTYEHSGSPTSSPTVTNAPTSEHSNGPTSSPTVTSAPTQTRSPTAFPTITSAPSQTKSPTSLSMTDDESSEAFEPSSSPSSSPGTGAGTVATGSPTVSDSTSAPTATDAGRARSICAADDNGDFLVPSSGGTVEELIVGYKYKMEINSNRANATDLLPSIEKALLDRLLQTLFIDLCASRRLAEYNGRKSRRLSIVGASARPSDIISTTDFCDSESSASDCSIIDGRMTVIANKATAVDSTEIEASICDVLNDENFLLGLHPSILNLECVSSLGNLVYDDDIAGSGNSLPAFEPVSDNLEAYSIVVSALSAIVIVLAIFGYRRRHHNKDVPTAVNHLDDSDVVNMSNSLSYEAGMLQPTMDFTPIHDPSYTAQGGIGVLARHSYFPESSIDEKSRETDSGEMLEEVSLDELNMTTSGSDLLVSS